MYATVVIPQIARLDTLSQMRCLHRTVWDRSIIKNLAKKFATSRESFLGSVVLNAVFILSISQTNNLATIIDKHT